MAHHSKIDFEKLFLKGHKSYDTPIGDWWDGQASNGAHRKAYAAVAEFVHERLKKSGKPEPKWLVDYACGSGYFLAALAARFPKARIVALDGSRKMLDRAGLRLAKAGHESGAVDAADCFAARGPRIRLVKTNLPNFSLPAGKADAVVFVFPNLTPAPADQDYYDKHGYKNREDVKVCTVLARLREMDPEDEVASGNPKEMYDGLMTDRVISRNLRHLTKKGGACFKVDYANAHRDELSELTRTRSLFVEGALEKPIKDMWCQVFFRYVTNEFHRSQVILDVYHQTKDPSDKTGGYFISEFTAV
ncbi:MAG TPA: class I SAM-dependent methyltransferase [Fibrobacteria bacterium]|nr:class I SAM-dependent methyltransferase [Fibrobacteria bacterium]